MGGRSPRIRSCTYRTSPATSGSGVREPSSSPVDPAEPFQESEAVVRHLTRRLLGQLLLAAGAASSARAASIPMPSGSPILKISGKIANANQDGCAVLDRGMLEALGMTTIVTKTPWYKQRVSFQGVRLSTLMQYVGAFG